jgi:SAM-dependent methyltransferase
MRWMAKALVHKALGWLPWRDDLNYLLQRRVTHSLPVTHETFVERSANAFRHLDVFRRHVQLPPREARFFEFGAGWDLEIPLILAAAGVGRQVVVDRRRLLRHELVAHNLRLLRAIEKELGAQNGWTLQLPATSDDPQTALRELGVEYRVANVADTGFPAGSFSFVHSTWTASHIPEETLPRVFQECKRLLAPGGVISCAIELRDNFSAFDPSISLYHYLRYTKRQWSWFDSQLLAQNRLRADDYYRIFEHAGLKIVEAEEVRPPEEYWRKELGRLKLAPPFREQPPERLAVTVIYVALRPK